MNLLIRFIFFSKRFFCVYCSKIRILKYKELNGLRILVEKGMKMTGVSHRTLVKSKQQSTRILGECLENLRTSRVSRRTARICPEYSLSPPGVSKRKTWQISGVFPENEYLEYRQCELSGILCEHAENEMRVPEYPLRMPREPDLW